MATATVSGGVVTGVTITNTGNYGSTPTVSIAQGSCMFQPTANALSATLMTADCTGGLMYGSMPTSGAYCQMLAVYDQVVAYANMIGLQVRLAPTPSSFLTSGPASCQLTTTTGGLPGPNGPNGSEVAIENCIKPLYRAMAQRWNTGANDFLNSFTVMHEPTGIWYQCNGGCQAWTVPDLENFIQNTAATIKAVAPSILTGAATQSNLNNGSETVYWNSWMSNIAASFNFAGIDVYPNSWDPSAQMTPGVFTPSVCTTLGSCTWSGGAYTLVQQWIATARTAGVTTLRVNETNRPAWTPTNCSNEDPLGFVDPAGSLILNNALDPAWQAAFVPWAAAQGFSSVSRFEGKVWVAYDPQNYSYVPYVTNVLMPVMPNLGNNVSGASWAAAAQHTAALQGGVTTSGTVKLSH
jgi:hypothetical protein